MAIETKTTLRNSTALLGVVVLIGVLVRTVVAARGWLYWDDLTLQSKAREPLSALLLQDHDGHLMPAAWVIEWFLGNVAPLNWPVAVAVLFALQLWAAGSVAWASRVIAGRHAPIPVALYLFTPLTLPSTTWLAAAINALPMHAALAMTLAAAWHRKPWQASLCLVIGLLFNERMLFAAPLVIAMMACFALASRRLRDRLPDLGRLALAVGIPAGLWAGLYLWVVDRPEAGEPLSVGELIRHSYLDALAPTAMGGPWHWERWHPSPPWAEPGWYAIVLGLLVIVLVAWWSRRFIVAWLPALLYPLLPIAAIALARSGEGTAYELVQSLRHFSELAVVVTLTLAFLLTKLSLPRVPASVLVALYIVSSLVSTIGYSSLWSEQPAREYFHNLKVEMQLRSEPLLDQAVPLEVLLPVTHPHNLLSHQLPEEVADSTTNPALVDGEGHLHEAELLAQRSSPDSSVCDTSSVELDGPLYDLEWTVLINYLADSDMEADIKLDGDSVRVPLSEGLNQVYVRVAGGGSTLNVEPVGDGKLCLGASHVGSLVAQ